MKTKDMAVRFGAAVFGMDGLRSVRFGRVAFVAAAICAAATSAFADIAMPHIVSHRGESQDRPENTMAAFRLAFERGVDGVECDVYCTSDGVPVIIHDSTTGRTAGSGTNLTVTASTWDNYLRTMNGSRRLLPRAPGGCKTVFCCGIIPP